MLHDDRLTGGGGGFKAIWAMPIWKQHISKRGFPLIPLLEAGKLSNLQIGGDQCTMNIQSSVESVGEIGRDILWRWRQVAITSPGQLNTEWILRLENEILGSICLLVTRNDLILQ